jgi:hypothetical protein
MKRFDGWRVPVTGASSDALELLDGLDVLVNDAGVAHLTRAIASELRHLGIRCMRRIPLRRPAEPGEQASVALFRCSAEASYVNGETIVVSRGQLAGFSHTAEDEPPVPPFVPIDPAAL